MTPSERRFLTVRTLNVAGRPTGLAPAVPAQLIQGTRDWPSKQVNNSRKL